MKDKSGPTTVYVCRASDRTIVYVGISATPRQRLATHRREKHWWSRVVLVELEYFANRDDAERREAELLGVHMPPWNTRGVIGPRQARELAQAERDSVKREDFIAPCRACGAEVIPSVHALGGGRSQLLVDCGYRCRCDRWWNVRFNVSKIRAGVAQ